MGYFYSFLFPWNFLLQGIAIVHFIRRRPDTYWLYIILIGGGLGAIAYIAVEVLPDFGLLRTSLKVFPRRRRIRELEAIILDNPAAGNYEELADLYLEEGKFTRARECYDKAISSRTDSPDPFYRRGLTEIELGDFPAAVADLERVIAKDPKYDFYRFLRSRKRILTMLISSLLKDASRKPANGRSECSRRNQHYRVI